MSRSEEIKKEVSNLQSIIWKLQMELKAVEKEEKKTDNLKLIGKCFRVLEDSYILVISEDEDLFLNCLCFEVYKDYFKVEFIGAHSFIKRDLKGFESYVPIPYTEFKKWWSFVLEKANGVVRDFEESRAQKEEEN